MLQYRGLHTSSSSTNNAPASLTAGANNRGPSCFGNGLGLSASSNPAGPMMSRAKQLSTRANATSFGPSTVSSNQIGAFHSASRANMAISAPLLIGGGQSAIQQLGSVEQLGGNVEEIISSAWASRAGAVIFAAAAAGSIFLNPIDRLRGSGGGGGGGDPNPGGSGGGGGNFEHKFDSPPKDEEDEKAKLSVDVTTAPRPYEVSRCSFFFCPASDRPQLTINYLPNCITTGICKSPTWRTSFNGR